MRPNKIFNSIFYDFVIPFSASVVSKSPCPVIMHSLTDDEDDIVGEAFAGITVG